MRTTTTPDVALGVSAAWEGGTIDGFVDLDRTQTDHESHASQFTVTADHPGRWGLWDHVVGGGGGFVPFPSRYGTGTAPDTFVAMEAMPRLLDPSTDGPGPWAAWYAGLYGIPTQLNNVPLCRMKDVAGDSASAVRLAPESGVKGRAPGDIAGEPSRAASHLDN